MRSTSVFLIIVLDQNPFVIHSLYMYFPLQYVNFITISYKINCDSDNADMMHGPLGGTHI